MLDFKFNILCAKSNAYLSASNPVVPTKRCILRYEAQHKIPKTKARTRVPVHASRENYLLICERISRNTASDDQGYNQHLHPI